MAWTKSIRRKYRRDGLRYASDLTDEEWALIEPLLPRLSTRQAVRKGAARRCRGNLLHRHNRLPVAATAQGFSALFHGSGLFLCMVAQRPDGERQSPSGHGAARKGRARGVSERRAIDSQSVKTTEAGGPRGFDAGKKIKARKRHILVDTQHNLLGSIVHGAEMQDRDGAPSILASTRSLYPWLRHVFADGGYAGDKLRKALKSKGGWTIEIIKRSDAAKGFVLLPRRWVVERTFAWIGRFRRLAKDFKATIESAVAWVLVANIRRLVRRLAIP